MIIGRKTICLFIYFKQPREIGLIYLINKLKINNQFCPAFTKLNHHGETENKICEKSLMKTSLAKRELLY